MAANMKDDLLARRLAAIADPGRREILRLLRKHPGMNASEIEQRLGLSQPTISHHMAVLRDCGLVQARRKGHFMHYRREEKALRELAEAVEEL